MAWKRKRYAREDTKKPKSSITDDKADDSQTGNLGTNRWESMKNVGCYEIDRESSRLASFCSMSVTKYESMEDEQHTIFPLRVEHATG